MLTTTDFSMQVWYNRTPSVVCVYFGLHFFRFISGFVLIQLQPPFVHFLCRQGLCNARSLWRLSVMRGRRIGQSRERSSLDHYTPGTLLNTGANRDHSNKSSQLLPNGKSAAPALLPSESVLSIGCWLNTLWDFF